MKGRVCLITGASSGIGEASAIGLAERGASLVLLCRDRGRGEAAIARIRSRTGAGDIELLIADLSSQSQIRAAAAQFLDSGRKLHVLLNNAGLIIRQRTVTEDGIETTFAVNHLAYFLLTNLLLARLRESAPARIVSVSSALHKRGYGDGRIAFDDLGGETAYSGYKAYGQSKLANILFTRELARRLDGTGVTANALHPGVVATGFAGNNRNALWRIARATYRPFSLSPERGARTSVWLATDPALATVTGRYFQQCKQRQPAPQARNDEDAARLWRISEQMTGLD